MSRLFSSCALAFALICCALGEVSAGRYNKVLNIGDRAPGWENLPGTDGKNHSLSEFKDRDVVVLVFTCNSCPVAEGYEDRILAFQKKHCGPGQKVGLVAINVNIIADDRLPKMTECAKEKGFTFPYLYDATQKIAKDYGATYTPEFFVLDKQRKIAYMGAMDDRVIEQDAKENYLEMAVSATLKGEAAKVTETLARGCLVRYVRPRE